MAKLRKAKKPNKRIQNKKRSNYIMLGLFFGMILFLSLYIWISNYTNQLIAEIDDLRHTESKMLTHVKIDKLDLDKLMRADRIKNIASSEIGMVVPKPETLAVVIQDNILEN